MNPEASDFVVQFFLTNKAVLLDNAASRTIESNNLRKQCVQRLVDELTAKFRIQSDVARVKQHFDNRKLKITKRGQDFQRQQARRPQDRKLSERQAFDNEMDRKLWEFITNDNRKEEGPSAASSSSSAAAGDKESEVDAVAIAMDLLKRHKEQEKERRSATTPPRSSNDARADRNCAVKWKRPRLPGRFSDGTPMNVDEQPGTSHASKQILSQEISDYILSYFMDNHEILLDNASSRSMDSNLERRGLVMRLVSDIQTQFGVETDAVKVRSHFDNRRAKIIKKGLDFKTNSGAGPSLTGQNVFESEIEARIWDYFDPTAETISNDSNSREGATISFHPDRVKDESPGSDDLPGGSGQIPQLFVTGPTPHHTRLQRAVLPTPMAISGITTVPIEQVQPSRKRRRESQDDDSPHEDSHSLPGPSHVIMGDRQTDLIEKKLKFYEENAKLAEANVRLAEANTRLVEANTRQVEANMKLVQKMSSALDLILARFGRREEREENHMNHEENGH